MHEPLVSVVMSVFNGARFLRESIQSILNQSFRSFEFIIVNDGSTDDSAIILEEFAKVDPRIRLFAQPNLGLVRSLNRGCALASGRYIARMDADDVALPGRLEAQTEFLEKYLTVGVVGGQVEYIDASGKSLRQAAMVVANARIMASLERGHCVIVHPTVLMRRDVFERVGGYRQSVVDAEDYDLWLRISDAHQLANLDQVVLKYRRHGGQISIKRFRQQAISNLAARLASGLRRRGLTDPLDLIDIVTEQWLTDMGISVAAQRADIARAYLTSAGNLSDSGSDAEALELLVCMHSDTPIPELPSNLVCDRHLLLARLMWKSGFRAKGVLELARAIGAHPAVLARPLKPFIRPTNLRSGSAKSDRGIGG